MSDEAKMVAKSDLELMRFELDLLDDQICDLLAGRFRRLRRVAEIKARGELAGHDAKREAKILARLEARLGHLEPEERTDVLEVLRGLLERGRGAVLRGLPERHDRSDAEAFSVDPLPRPPPAR